MQKAQGLDFAAERQPGRGAHGRILLGIRAEIFEFFAPRLIRLKRVQDEMRLQLGVEAQPIIDRATSEQALSQEDIDNCHDLLADLVVNESKPEDGYKGFGSSGDFYINVMSFGGVIYWIKSPEFDDIGYFKSGEEAKAVAEI